MSRWRWALLIFELVLFALILVLPQVALPVFTFHGGTAPVVTHTRFSATPVRFAIIVFVLATSTSLMLFERRSETLGVPPQTGSGSRLALFCTLLC